MSWLACAILARFFWACCNMLDQYTARYAGHNSGFAYLIIVHIMLLPVILVVAACMDSPWPVHPASFIWLGTGVVACLGGLFPYLLALKNDEAHNVVPLFDLVSVFVVIIAWLLFGDRLVGAQLLGAILIVVAGFCLSWDFDRGHIRLKTLLLMTGSSLCYALYQIALRYSVEKESVWHIMFFMSCGLFLSSFAIFVAMPKARRLFLQSVRRSHGKVLVVAFAQNLFDFVASTLITYAFANAPGAGYVAALGPLQSFFILLLGVILGLRVPGHYALLKWNREMQVKCLLLCVIAAGIVLLKST